MKNILIITSLLISSFSMAAAPARPTLAPQPRPVIQPKPVIQQQPEVESEFSFGGSFGTRISSQVEKQDDGTRAQYFTHELMPYFKTGDFKLTGTFDYYNYFDKTESSDWENTQFDAVLGAGWTLADIFQLTPQALLILPLFKKSGGDFQYAAGGRLTAALKSKDVDMPNLIFKYGLQILKFGQKNEVQLDENKQFKLDANGEKQYNTDLRIRQRLHLGYMLTEKLMAMIYFHFDSNLLFDGNFRNGFAHETFMEYTVNDNFSINAGVNNGGGLYVGDYQEKDNLKFYSKESSEYFAGIGINF